VLTTKTRRSTKNTKKILKRFFFVRHRGLEVVTYIAELAEHAEK